MEILNSFRRMFLNVTGVEVVCYPDTSIFNTRTVGLSPLSWILLPLVLLLLMDFVTFEFLLQRERHLFIKSVKDNSVNPNMQ